MVIIGKLRVQREGRNNNNNNCTFSVCNVPLISAVCSIAKRKNILHIAKLKDYIISDGGAHTPTQPSD